MGSSKRGIQILEKYADRDSYPVFVGHERINVHYLKDRLWRPQKDYVTVSFVSPVVQTLLKTTLCMTRTL